MSLLFIQIGSDSLDRWSERSAFLVIFADVVCCRRFAKFVSMHLKNGIFVAIDGEGSGAHRSRRNMLFSCDFERYSGNCHFNRKHISAY